VVQGGMGDIKGWREKKRRRSSNGKGKAKK